MCWTQFKAIGHSFNLGPSQKTFRPPKCL